MNHRVSRLALCAAILVAAAAQARAIDVKQRSYSLSKQFIVYSDDRGVRLAIAGASDEIKKGVLSLLGISGDGWKYPIVISAQHASTATPHPVPSSVQLFETDEGFKVEFDLCIDSDPLDVRFQQQLVRAILLEFAYRDKNAIKDGVAYGNPPVWLIEGMVAVLQSRENGGVDADVFKTLVSANHLPQLKTFLEQNTNGADTTSRAIYSACALSLLQTLVDLPDGHASLAAYIRDLAQAGNDTTAELMKHFPALGGSEQALEKRWSLNMARLSASDRYAGLSVEDTEQRAAALLTMQLPTGKKGATKKFTIDQFNDYLKIRESRAALEQMSSGFLALQTSANPLFRPVILEYQKIAFDLARGKTKGIPERLADVGKYRKSILGRVNDIADYLNWFEGTQMTTRSDAFAGYLKAASELSVPAPKRKDPISKYIDALEGEYQ